MSQTASVPPYVNSAMKVILRSPLHGLVSQTILLISFTGRRSGKTYSTPVSYSMSGDQVTIFTHATWWKNLRGGAPVSLRIRGGERRGLAEPVAGDREVIAAGLAAHLQAVPGDARWYGVRLDRNGIPDAEQVKNAAGSVVMLRIKLV